MAAAGAAIAGRKNVFKEYLLRSEKQKRTNIRKRILERVMRKSSMSMNPDREWSEDDMDWSFKIQDEKQLNNACK